MVTSDDAPAVTEVFSVDPDLPTPAPQLTNESPPAREAQAEAALPNQYIRHEVDHTLEGDIGGTGSSILSAAENHGWSDASASAAWHPVHGSAEDEFEAHIHHLSDPCDKALASLTPPLGQTEAAPMVQPLQPLSEEQRAQLDAEREQLSHDCLVGEWGAWGECHRIPKEGTDGKFMVRTRLIINPRSGRGKACPYLTEELECEVDHQFTTVVRSFQNAADIISRPIMEPLQDLSVAANAIAKDVQATSESLSR